MCRSSRVFLYGVNFGDLVLNGVRQEVRWLFRRGIVRQASRTIYISAQLY
jgi:hypothetical protein